MFYKLEHFGYTLLKRQHGFSYQDICGNFNAFFGRRAQFSVVTDKNGKRWTNIASHIADLTPRGVCSII